MRVGLSLLLLLYLAAPSLAQNSSKEAEIENFFDGFLSAQLLSYRIPGAALAIVHGGEILHCKGYGLANIRTGQPIRARKTLFRIASVSKPIVYTATMQLVEEGSLSLHGDVNDYLKSFKIPKPFGKAVTLAHLMTHTPGFEDTYFRKWSQKMKRFPTLREYLSQNRPACIRPPGETYGYSNYGASLAGYLIERATNTTYETYLEKNIFKPLGMKNTTARQPLPKKFKKHMAVSYRNGRPIGFELILDSPAGAISSTAEDMAKFMIAHLGWGPKRGQPILSEESFNAMHERQFAHHKMLDGHTFGFVHEVINGERVISHSGAMVAFRTRMIMLPDLELGLFVAYTSGRGSEAGRQLKGVFLDRCLPKKEPPETKQFIRSAKAQEGLAGWYRKTRYSHTSAAKVAGLLGATLPLSLDGSNLSFLHSRWRPIAPDVYEEITRHEHPRRLAFKRKPRSKPKFVYVGMKAYERVEWYERPTVQWAIFILCQLIFVSYMAKSLWRLLRKRRERRSPFLPKRDFWHQITLLTTSLLNSSLAATLCLLLLSSFNNPVRVFYGLPWWVVIPSAATYLSALLAPLALLTSWSTWKKRHHSLLDTCHDYTVVLAAFTFVLWLHHWNLLGYKY